MRQALKTELSLEKDIDTLRAEMVEKENSLNQKIVALEAALAALKTKPANTEAMQNIAWQALHSAAAAACRGSTPRGGHGHHANVVLPKLNTDSCKNLCGKTRYKFCDADIAILGYTGKATSYTSLVGKYYNYGCSSPGNTNKEFDEVKAGDHEILEAKASSHYYRYCCCRY